MFGFGVVRAVFVESKVLGHGRTVDQVTVVEVVVVVFAVADVDPGEFYPYLPLDDEVDEPAPAPAEADPEEDAELICRPRTTGGNA